LIENLLEGISLHPAFGDPVLEAMNFLNEIMKRHPEAISFAPGAPNLLFLEDYDYNRSITAYLEHVQMARSCSPNEAMRLLYEYGPAQGLICDLVAEALQLDEGLRIDKTDILITVGAQEGIFLALRALFRNRMDVLAVVTPCYVGIRGAASLLGIDIVPVHEAADGVNFDELCQHISDARIAGRAIRAIYIAPDHANPSGTVMSLSQRHKLLALAESEDFYIFEDNAYGFTTALGSALPSLKALDRTRRVVFIGTFAKICLPGARVGFVAADQSLPSVQSRQRSLAQAMASAKSMITVNTSPICQAIIGGMLLQNGCSLVSLGKTKAEFYRRNLAHLVAALDRELDPAIAKWNHPSGGFFVLVDLPVPANAELLEDCARNFGVLWTPMSQFHLDGGGRCQLRLSCSYLSLPQIDEGVRRLAGFLRGLPKPTSSAAS